jgi:hypothetical protein
VPVTAQDRALLWGGAALGAVSTLLPKVALISVFVAWIVIISRQRLRQIWPRLAPFAIAIAVAGSLLGLLRFTLSEAIPGILRGGTYAADKKALSQLRQVVVAQDALRRGAFMDHDGDGVGSAGRIAELAGLAPLRGGGVMDPPALSYKDSQLIDTAIGPAVEVGAYLLVVCLPTADGAWSAQPSLSIDEERAERSYYAYAWPVATGLGVTQVYCTDQHERIWVSANQEAGTLRYAGPGFPPSCNAVLDSATGFEPWMDKQARPSLPGDTPR